MYSDGKLAHSTSEARCLKLAILQNSCSGGNCATLSPASSSFLLITKFKLHKSLSDPLITNVGVLNQSRCFVSAPT